MLDPEKKRITHMEWHSSGASVLPGFYGVHVCRPVFLGLSPRVLKPPVVLLSVVWGLGEPRMGPLGDSVQAIAREAGIDLIISGHKHEQKVD